MFFVVPFNHWICKKKKSEERKKVLQLINHRLGVTVDGPKIKDHRASLILNKACKREEKEPAVNGAFDSNYLIN